MDIENLFAGEVINGDWKQREIFDGLQHVKSRSVSRKANNLSAVCVCVRERENRPWVNGLSSKRLKENCVGGHLRITPLPCLVTLT
jgi:hypothetical protein